eukprot:gene3868-4820_t
MSSRIAGQDEDGGNVYQFGTNSFVMSAYEAYSNHHHLVIRPDDVWMAVVIQFCSYVNANSEVLRSRFVDFQGVKEVKIATNGNLFSAGYDEMAIRMSDQIAGNIKDPSVRNWVIPSFSTTTYTDRVVGSIALMASMKKYLSFKFKLYCGLPRVTMLGTVDDWKDVKTRIERLKEFDTGDNRMEEWTSMLIPIADQFIESVSGKPDIKWWNRIAHYISGESGPSYLSGWITCFCVFDDQGQWVGDKHSVDVDLKKYKSEWIYVNSLDIPTGYLSVPLTIDDNGVEFQTEMMAGHMCVNIPNKSSTISPQLDWCIFVKSD